MRNLSEYNASRLIQQVEDIITDPNLVEKGTFLWIAVSGGLDSVSLFHTIHRIWVGAKKDSFAGIGIVHVDHQLRAQESTGDANFVRKLAKSYGVPLFEKKVIWAKGEKKNQESAREKREIIYREVLKKHPKAKIVLGHHLDDQAETIFLRLLRGTGLQGLRGMHVVSEEKLRPFLSVKRSQIQSAAIFWKIKWREDSSNKKSKYERNWLRLKIFPELEKRRAGFAEKLAALAAEAQAEYKVIEKIEPIVFEEGEFFLQEQLKNLSSGELVGLFQLERKHLPQVRKVLASCSGITHIPGRAIWVSCGMVLLARDLGKWEKAAQEKQNSFVKKKTVHVKTILGEWKLPQALAKQTTSRRVVGNGRLKKKFIEQKIPAFFRALIPLVEIQNKFLIPCSRKDWWREGTIDLEKFSIQFKPSHELQKIYSKTKPRDS